MTIVELSAHGSSLRRRGERFLVGTKNPETGDTNSEEVAAEHVEAILVSANAMISTSAIKLCTERQIQLVIADWVGHPFARMWSSTPGRQTEIRRAQYAALDAEVGNEITRDLVIEKLRGQAGLLRDLKNNRGYSAPREIEEGLGAIRDAARAARTLPNSHELRSKMLGIEGSAASRYFAALSAALPEQWRFEGRSQNPGTDPFNASLNYMYGIGYSGVAKVAILSGLDPNAGFYHADRYGHPVLTYDLIEPCRPTIDRALLPLFTKREATKSWFEHGYEDPDGEGLPALGNAVRISPDGRKRLITAYKLHVKDDLERATWERCRKITQTLMGGAHR